MTQRLWASNRVRGAIDVNGVASNTLQGSGSAGSCRWDVHRRETCGSGGAGLRQRVVAIGPQWYRRVLTWSGETVWEEAMDNRNTVEIILPAYARPRSEGERKAIQELVDKIKGQHGVDVTLSAQAEYRSHEMAVGIVVIEVLVGSNAHYIVRPVIDALIRQVVSRFQNGPGSGQVIFQPVTYINGNNNVVNNIVYDLRDGRADDEEGEPL